MLSLVSQTRHKALAQAGMSIRASTARAKGPLQVVVAQTEAELAPYEKLWSDLAGHALEPNVFYESWMLLPALRAFSSRCRLRVVLVLKPVPDRVEPVLCGIFPMEERWGYKGLPVRYLALWQHPYSFLGLPLLRADCARECFEVFLDWLAHDRQGAALLELPSIPADGAFYHLLVDLPQTRSCSWYVAQQYTRAILRPRSSAEEILRSALSARERKDLRRKEKRLRELGHAEYRTLQAEKDLELWIEAFLRMEASGWKGRCGTAMASRPEDRHFFATIVREAFRRGQLWMQGLFLNEECIALKCSFRSEGGSFAFKIAFDERHGSISPGYQLEVAAIRELHLHCDIPWLDSCTAVGPSMFDRLWIDRRVISTILLSTGRPLGDLAVSVLPLLRWLKRQLGWPKRQTYPSLAPGSPGGSCQGPVHLPPYFSQGTERITGGDETQT